MFCYNPNHEQLEKITAEATKLVGKPITVAQAVILATEIVCGKEGKGLVYRSQRTGLERWVRRELKRT